MRRSLFLVTCVLIFLLAPRLGYSDLSPESWAEPVTGIKFLQIPGGHFVMGSPSTEEGRQQFAEKQHPVSVGTFWLAETEVTQAEWKVVMGQNPSHFKDDDRPVERVSWFDVQEFIERLNQAAGEQVYRLPTEAEWEYAARAGTEMSWSFGEDEIQLDDYAWYYDNAWNEGEKYGHPVGMKQPNPWDLYDMHGNVWEWVEDWYDNEYYFTDAASTDPPGPAEGSSRVIRGGAFFDNAPYSRAAQRAARIPDFDGKTEQGTGIGARLIRVK